MTESSAHTPATAINLESLILRRLAAVKNNTVAQAIKHDESHISRFASNQAGIKLCDMQALFDVLGLKVIECDGPTVTIPSKTFEALKHLVKESL